MCLQQIQNCLSSICEQHINNKGDSKKFVFLLLPLKYFFQWKKSFEIIVYSAALWWLWGRDCHLPPRSPVSPGDGIFSVDKMEFFCVSWYTFSLWYSMFNPLVFNVSAIKEPEYHRCVPILWLWTLDWIGKVLPFQQGLGDFSTWRKTKSTQRRKKK